MRGHMWLNKVASVLGPLRAHKNYLFLLNHVFFDVESESEISNVFCGRT